MGIKISGLAAAVPDNKVTNHDLAKTLDTSDEWIRGRTGIQSRYHAHAEQTTGYLAYQAGKAAIDSMCSPSEEKDIDTLILATTTPDRACPATAPKVAARLKLDNVSAFDISAVCSGFVYGLSVAEGLLRSGQSKRLLLIGADVFSTVLDPADRVTYPLFGDAAGAMILEYDSKKNHLIATSTGSDGNGYDLLTIKSGGGESKLAKATSSNNSDHFFSMDGKAVFVQAISHKKHAVVDMLEAQQLKATDIDCLVPHQANLRIINTLLELLDLGSDKALISLREFGNTSAASIPLTLAKGCMEGNLHGNDKIVVTAFGGGLTWGAALFIWPEQVINANIIVC